jgi:hypothetical protein
MEVIGVMTLRDVISCFIHEPQGYCDNVLASAMQKTDGKRSVLQLWRKAELMMA